MLNPPSGNMYSWAHTWKPLRGACIYNCSYCSTTVKRKYSGKPEIDEVVMKDNLYRYGKGTDKSGKEIIIFVQNTTDLFASNVPSGMIRRVLKKCCEYPLNTYLFQTKNPERFVGFLMLFPPKFILGTTIETNRSTSAISKAPSTQERCATLSHLSVNKMINIEPITDLDVDPLVAMIKSVNPNFVSIGADSKNSDLKEPSADKVKLLIKELEKFTEVRLKSNLSRILKKEV